jgi:hypothetical protein
MLNYVNSNLCSTIKRDEQRQEMGSLHQPGGTKTELLFIQYRASCTQKTQIHLHSFPIQPDTKTSHGQQLLFILGPHINKKNQKKNKRENTKN